jgi:pilus assembly protein FimV
METLATATASTASAADEAKPVVTPAETEDLSAVKPAQVEVDVSELDLSPLDGLDDLSELETLEDLEALEGLETLEELEDLSELETLALSDVGDMSETGVGSELDVDPDEDPANMLDLARAYVDMGDSDAARGLLNRVAVIGTSSEATEAQKMLVSISED